VICKTKPVKNSGRKYSDWNVKKRNNERINEGVMDGTTANWPMFKGFVAGNEIKMDSFATITTW